MARLPRKRDYLSTVRAECFTDSVLCISSYPGQEEVAQGDVMASLAFLPKGLDKEAREKHGDDVESVASWQSLPLHEEQGGNGRQDGEHGKVTALLLKCLIVQPFSSHFMKDPCGLYC